MARLTSMAAVLILASLGTPALSGGEKKPPEVMVRHPHFREVVEYELFKGTVVPAYQVEIQPRVTGVIEKVLFRDGAVVKAGDVLFELDAQQAKLTLERTLLLQQLAEATLGRLNEDAARLEKLVAQAAASRDDLIRLAKQRDEAAISLRVARLDVQKARLDLDYTVIRAPLGGRIGRALIGPGNQVAAGTPLATIIGVEPLQIAFEVPDEFIVRFRQIVGNDESKYPPQVAVASGGGEIFTPSRVVFVDNKVDPRTRTLHARALLDNRQQVALPGMVGGVRLPATMPRRVLAVPKSAVKMDISIPYLFIVNDKNVVELRSLKIGPVIDDDVVILNGVAPDEWVVLEPQRVRLRQEVTPKKHK